MKEAINIIKLAALCDDSVLLVGPHGVGKSEIVKRVAEEEGMHLETLFLSQQEVGDLIGIPHTVEVGGVLVTTWSKPVWLRRMEEAAKEGKKCILFLDELNRAAVDIRQSALQLILERKMHEHTLPVVDGQRTCVVAAINPSDTGEYQVDELDPALMDRFIVYEVEPDSKGWLEWAKDNGINHTVMEFIRTHPDRLYWQPSDGGVGATPRSWEKLSNYLNLIKTNKTTNKIDDNTLFQLIKGKIGSEIGSQFFTFLKNYVKVIKVEDIEKIVKDNEEKEIEEIGEIIADRIQDLEAIQKSELAEQINDKGDMRTLLAYLYATEVEICIAFLKNLRFDNPEKYRELAELDGSLNGKELFRRIIRLANNE